MHRAKPITMYCTGWIELLPPTSTAKKPRRVSSENRTEYFTVRIVRW